MEPTDLANPKPQACELQEWTVLLYTHFTPISKSKPYIFFLSASIKKQLEHFS